MKRSFFIATISAIIVIISAVLFLLIQILSQSKTDSTIKDWIIYDQSTINKLSYSVNDRREIPLKLEEIFPADSWCEVEFSQALKSNFRWAKGNNSELLIPLINKDDCILYLRMFSFPHPSQKEQKIRILLNNNYIETLTITPTEAEYSIILPEGSLNTGNNWLTFLSSYAIQPKQIGQGSDTRSLSFAISGLAIKGGLLYYQSDSPGNAQQVIGGFVPLNFSFDLKMPKKTTLKFCYRYRFFSPDLYCPFPIRFSVVAYQGERKVEIFRSEETPLKKGDNLWRQVSLNLGKYGGRLKGLTFSASIPQSSSFKEEITNPFPLYVEFGSHIVFTPVVERENDALNIILISVDALRADHLGCYGYNIETSPFMDRLAAKGILFQQAYSCATWTLPSHASILSGLLPSRHGLFQREKKLSQNIPFLPEIFKQNGYATLGLTCGGHLSEDFGWDRGFDFFSSYTTWHDQRSQYAFSQAKNWIYLNYTKPFFIFLHTYETHIPLIPPEPYRTMFYPEYRGSIITQRKWIEPEETRKLNDSDKRKIISLYDGEIRYTDDLISSLFDTLKKYNIDKKTLIIITADHGEEFWDNSEKAMIHGILKRHIAEVPLIIWNPILFPNPRVVSTPVSLADIAPTIIDATKAKNEYTASSFDGISLLPYLQSGEALPERHIFCQEVNGNLLLAFWKEFQYNFSLSDQKGELYNLKTDPLETHDLSDDLPDIVKIMQQGILKKLGGITNKTLLKISGRNQPAPFRIKIATDTYLMGIESIDIEKEDIVTISPDRKEAEIVSNAFNDTDIFIIQTLRMDESLYFTIEHNSTVTAPENIALGYSGDYPSSNPFSIRLIDFMLASRQTAYQKEKAVKADSSDKPIFIAMIEEKDRYQASPLKIDDKLIKELKALGYLSNN